MRLIQQQDDFTCGVACAAMVADVTFEQALAKSGDLLPFRCGMASLGLSRLLRRLGVRFTRKMLPKLNRCVPHIIVVPSLNVLGGLHYVVADLSDAVLEVYDPQEGRPGKRYYRRRRDDDDGNPLSVPMTSYAEVLRVDAVRRIPKGGHS